MRPDYHQAIIDTIQYYGWQSIIYLYDSHDGEYTSTTLIHLYMYVYIPSSIPSQRDPSHTLSPRLVCLPIWLLCVSISFHLTFICHKQIRPRTAGSGFK